MNSNLSINSNLKEKKKEGKILKEERGLGKGGMAVAAAVWSRGGYNLNNIWLLDNFLTIAFN